MFKIKLAKSATAAMNKNKIAKKRPYYTYDQDVSKKRCDNIINDISIVNSDIASHTNLKSNIMPLNFEDTQPTLDVVTTSEAESTKTFETLGLYLKHLK